MTMEKVLRDQLLNLLDGKGAHASFEHAISDLPPTIRGKKAPALPYTIWELVEHMRIAQWDILEFSRNPDHVSPGWPDGYWPGQRTPEDDPAWQKSVDAFRCDLRTMKKLVKEPSTDLFRPIPHGDGKTLLRETLLVADHNAYHLGQIVLIRKLLNAWPAS